MRHLAQACLIVAIGPLSGIAQAQGGQATNAPTPACALLSVAEVRSITGHQNYPEYVDGDPDGEGAGGGSSCQYGGATMMPGQPAPLLSIVLINGKNWTERSRTFVLPPGCQREPVAELGDAAFFQSCPVSRSKRTPPLYVRAGTSDLIVQMDVEPPATLESVRPLVIAIAKAAVVKLR